MFEIVLTETIDAPQALVWDVISKLDEYPEWNEFVVACESTLEVDSPIVMQVRVMPSRPMRQVETITGHRPGEFLEYGMRAPLGSLSSTRWHKLTAVDATTTEYESMFRLKGPLSALVGTMLGRNLRRGFTDMTRGIVKRAQDNYEHTAQPGSSQPGEEQPA